MPLKGRETLSSSATAQGHSPPRRPAACLQAGPPPLEPANGLIGIFLLNAEVWAYSFHSNILLAFFFFCTAFPK